MIFFVYFSLISFFFLSLGGTCRVKLSRDINETGLQLTNAGLDVLKDKSFIVTELDHTSGILLYIQATSNETNDRTISQHSEKRKGKEKMYTNINLPYVFALSNSTTTTCLEPSLFHARKTTHARPKECLK